MSVPCMAVWENERMNDVDPWSLEGTQEFVKAKVASGMYEYGRPLEEILIAVLEEGLGIYGFDDALTEYAKLQDEIHREYIFSKYRACSKCHVVKDVEQEMVCTNCAAGKSKWADAEANP